MPGLKIQGSSWPERCEERVNRDDAASSSLLPAHGRFTTLLPLALKDAQAMVNAADEDCFRYHPDGPSEPTVQSFEAYIERSIADQKRATFAIWLTGAANESTRLVGVTSYLDISSVNRSLEIGATWIGAGWRGTRINPDVKLSMLAHAFDVWGAVRVQLKCDSRNLESQAAIAKLGAVKEGVLRRHRIMPDGYIRDTVYYSIISNEWPRVRSRLEERLA